MSATDTAVATATATAAATGSPMAWWDGPYERHQARHDEAHDVGTSGTWTDLADLLEPGRMAALHARIRVQDGAPANTAAKWAAGWTIGAVAGAVGFALATTGAGVLAGTGRCRVRVNPDGWAERVDLRGSTTLVAPGHRWAGCEGVEVVAAEDVLRRTRDALVELASPFVTALRPLGRVGAASLWAEVADEVGLSIAHAPGLLVTDEVVTRLTALLDLPGAPWRKRPELRAAPVAGGRGCLARKAGCCLAYLVPGEEGAVDASAQSERQREWSRRFPPAADPVPRTCSTCSLRELADCEERQRVWFELDHAAG